MGYAGQDSDTHAVGELPHMKKSTLRGRAVPSLVLTAAPRTQTAPGAAAMAESNEMWLLAPFRVAEPELLKESPRLRGGAESRNREKPSAGGRTMPSAGNLRTGLEP